MPRPAAIAAPAPTVHDQAHYRVWQRRFFPFSIYTEKKCLEKLNYMHNNSVKRGLVASPGDWPWSSWRFYYLADASILEVDRLDVMSDQRPAAAHFNWRRPEKQGLRQPDLTLAMESPTSRFSPWMEARPSNSPISGKATVY